MQCRNEDLIKISNHAASIYATLSHHQSDVSAPLVGSAVRSVSSKERERGGEEEARRELEEEERRRQEEEKKLEVEEEEEEEGEEKKRKYGEGEEEEEEEGRSLGSESYTTAASSLSYNVCKICHCGGEVVTIIMEMIVNPSL